MAEMVRRSACRGSKSVEARTISSPDPPVRGVQHFDRVAAGLGRLGQLGPGVRAVAVQVQRAARDHDPAVAHAHHAVFVLDVVGEGDGRLARVGLGLGADVQLPVQHDPLGGQLQVGLSAKLSLPLIVRPLSAGGLTSRSTSLSCGDGDLVACGWHLAVRPGGRIRPARLSVLPALRQSAPERQRTRCRAGMLEGAKPEGTSDMAYSRNQPPVMEVAWKHRGGKA